MEEDRIARLSDRTHSGRYTLLSAEKLRGGYYTSAEVARWICAWAVRSQEDCVLEPSCGDGVFVAAAANRLRELGATCAEARQRVTGIEIVEEEAKKARERLGRRLAGSMLTALSRPISLPGVKSGHGSHSTPSLETLRSSDTRLSQSLRALWRWP